MKKAVLVVFVIILSVALLFYLSKQREQNIQTKNAEEFAKYQIERAIKQQKHDDKLNELKPNGLSPRSLNDDIQYYKFLREDGTFRLAALGSSVTLGAGASSEATKWTTQLRSSIGKTFLQNNGYGGYTTKQIVEENKVNDVIKFKPDMVLFEVCLLNDFNKNIPIDKTLANITVLIQKIHETLPDTKVILLSPNSSPKTEGKNGLGLELQNYVDQTKSLAEHQGLRYIDVYGGFKEAKANEKDYFYDGLHPNDQGYKLWYDIVKADFEKKL